MIKNLTIHGFRGFGQEKTIQFAVPDGKSGSGLTILVGANNSGKTTIFEALRSFNSPKDNPPSFSERKRNIKCENGKVHLLLKTTNDEEFRIDTISGGGSTTTISKVGEEGETWWDGPKVFILQSRRFVDYEFHKNIMGRADYVRNQQMNIHNRTASIYEFNARLFKMQKNKETFDVLLKQVLGYDLEWTIEQNENGSYYLKLIINGCTHSSEGLGDGIWSVFTICDALYDSEVGSIIAIDEPELSLHPAYQKRIIQLFKEYSKDRQIIISTHSPYFVDMDSLINGAFLCRTIKDEDGNIDVFTLSDNSKRTIEGFLKNINQPHTLGTEAKEMFFLEDRIIITEGQEDVIMYNKAATELGMKLSGNFFGWGSGGASNISKIATILQELGYKKVIAVFDGDKPEDLEKFEEQFPTYSGMIISESDVRDKPCLNKPAKSGLMTQAGKIKAGYENEIKELFAKINAYLEK